MAAHMIQLEMLAEMHNPTQPITFHEMELKKQANGDWKSGPFKMEDSERQKSTW